MVAEWRGNQERFKMPGKSIQASNPRFIFSRPWPLWTYLVLFAASVALPLLSIAVYFLEQAVELEQGRLERQLLQTAQTLVSDIDRDIERTIAVLETLATSEALERGDYAAFHAQARRAVQSTSGAVLLIDPTMQQLLNTWVDFGAPLPKTQAPRCASCKPALPTCPIYFMASFPSGRQLTWMYP
jgi:hypothetical protein